MKKCPNCGGTIFGVGIQYSNCTIDYRDNEIIFGIPENELPHKKCMCANCGTQYNFDDPATVNKFVHQPVQCTKCGRTVMEDEVDENGVCIICRAKEVNPGLANFENASPDMLFRALATATIENFNLTTKGMSMNKDLDKAKEAEEKPKRKYTKKKKEEPVAEQVEEVVNVDDTEEFTSDLEISEDTAPEMPTSVVDMSNAMNPPEEE